MTITGYESNDSHHASRSDGKETLTRKFHVFSDDPATDFPSAFEVPAALFNITTTNPDGDEVHIGVQYGDPFYDHNGVKYDDYRATGVTARPVSEDRHKYEVVWTYTNTGGFDPTEQGGGAGGDPAAPGHTEFSSDHSFQFVDFYRIDTPAPIAGTEGTLFVPTDGDPYSFQSVKGLPIDEAGLPTSHPVITQTLEYSQTLNASQFDLITSSGVWYDRIGRRNSDVWRGAAIGTVVYMGHSTTRVQNGVYRVTHRFSWDEYYHMRQYALDKDGDKQIDVDVWQHDEAQHATHVRWIQPFPHKEAFGTVFPPF